MHPAHDELGVCVRRGGDDERVDAAVKQRAGGVSHLDAEPPRDITCAGRVRIGHDHGVDGGEPAQRVGVKRPYAPNACESNAHGVSSLGPVWQGRCPALHVAPGPGCLARTAARHPAFAAARLRYWPFHGDQVIRLWRDLGFLPGRARGRLFAARAASDRSARPRPVPSGRARARCRPAAARGAGTRCSSSA